MVSGRVSRVSYGPEPLPVPPGWREPLDRWAAALVAAGLSKQTLSTRADHLRRAARALGASPAVVTAADLAAWVGDQVWARDTRRSVYASLRSFWRWAYGAGVVAVDAAAGLPKVRPSDPAPRPAPDHAYTFALAGSDKRLALILRLAALVGMRRGEIAQVHARDLISDLVGWSLIVHGKGDRTRIVPIPDVLAAELLALGDRYVFPGRDGGHISARWVGKLAAASLPEGWTLHTLRHRYATRAYAGTRDLLAVQRLLGHASPATTQRYVRPPDEAMRRAMLAAAA